MADTQHSVQTRVVTLETLGDVMTDGHQVPAAASHFLSGKQKRIDAVLFLISVTLAAHFAFSWMGYNPSDDGFNLAYSRRLLDGQIPHKDFIAIRPIGTALLHAPVVWLGGDYTFWLSRAFVWFELASIAWAWVSIVGTILQIFFGRWERFVLGAIVFSLCAHTFPIMAWYTVDSLFLTSVGLVFAQRSSSTSKFAGYLLVGSAYVCKQNFLLLPIACLVLLGDWRKARYWLAVALPGGLYVGILAILGALPDAFTQITSQHDLIATGVLPYYNSSPLAIGAIVAYVSMRLLYGKVPIVENKLSPRAQTFLPVGTLFASIVLAACMLPSLSYAWKPTFMFMGTVLGAVVFFILDDPEQKQFARIGMLILATAWTTSLALAFTSPALTSGLFALFLLAVCHVHAEQRLTIASHKVFTYLTAAVGVFCIIMFVQARSHQIYNERPAAYLNYPLGSVFPGGKMIQIDAQTYDFLRDLNVLLSTNPQRRPVLMSSMCGYWVKAKQTNVLSIDMPNSNELNTERLVNRVKGDLQRRRGCICVIIPKVNPADIATTFKPLNVKVYPLMNFVIENFTKVGETKFFEIYE